MKSEENYVDLLISDGTEMSAYTAFPENNNSKLPAIILLQEAFGVNQHLHNVADHFAKEGFMVICPELFHRSAKKGETFSYNDFPSVMPHYSALTNDGLTADLQACYRWLIEQHNVDIESIFSIGYCMGGKVSFLANAVLPIKAGVSYYGGGVDQLAHMAKDLHGRHLFFWGGLDKHIKDENIDTIISAMETSAKNFINVKISFADHGFNCNERPAYNKAAANDALALTLAFMRNS